MVTARTRIAHYDRYYNCIYAYSNIRIGYSYNLTYGRLSPSLVYDLRKNSDNLFIKDAAGDGMMSPETTVVNPYPSRQTKLGGQTILGLLAKGRIID